MYYREFGNAGFAVSEIGMGCNRLGEPAMPDAHWVDLVHAAIDMGVNLFDTSESYGWGRSEEILGLAIGNRSDVYVATKVSRIRETNARDFSSARIVAQVEASLKRLQRDWIDIYQLHSPSLEDMKSFDWPEAMTKLKEQGKIRLAGVSINDAASGRWLVEQGLVEAMQVAYNMIDWQTGAEVFPLAAAAGVGTMVRMPMAQGILTGKFTPGEPVAGDHRANLAGKHMGAMIDLAERFKPLAQQFGLPLATIALRYAITPTGVSSAIPGARTVEQLKQNVSASDGKGLEAEVLGAIAAIQEGLPE